MTKLTDEPSFRPSDDGFVKRWSERKREAVQDNDLSADLHTTDEQPPGDEDMPPVEALTEDSDYAPFLSPRVSVNLQRLALRKLFGVPSFNVRDGLDDYDDDFSTFATLGDVITADMRHRLEREVEKLAASPADRTATQQDSLDGTADVADSQLTESAESTEGQNDDPDDATASAGSNTSDLSQC